MIKANCKNQKIYLALFFSLFLLLTVPCESTAESIPETTPYDLTIQQGSITTITGNTMAASLDFADSDGNSLHIDFLQGGSYTLSGTLGTDVYVGVSGEYSVDTTGRIVMGRTTATGTLESANMEGFINMTFIPLDAKNQPGKVTGGTGAFSILQAPLPTPALLLGTGIVGLIGVRRKKLT